MTYKLQFEFVALGGYSRITGRVRATTTRTRGASTPGGALSNSHVQPDREDLIKCLPTEWGHDLRTKALLDTYGGYDLQLCGVGPDRLTVLLRLTCGLDHELSVGAA